MPTSFSHRPARHWLQIDISVPSHLIDYVSHQLTRLTGNGVQLLSRNRKQVIIAYLEKNDTYPAARTRFDTFIAELATTLTIPLDLSLSTLVEENWAENWKENYQPTQITDTITVKPTWSTYDSKPYEVVIEIDPGMAFGTGLHSSTRLALNFLDQLFSHDSTKPSRVLDVGTGTGILAIAAAKLGAELVLATDNDIDAVVAARDNVAQNAVAKSVTCTDTPLCELQGLYDLVIANITADILTELCPDLVRMMAPGSHLILAGILHGEQQTKVSHCFRKTGLQPISDKTEEKWVSLLFSRQTIS